MQQQQAAQQAHARSATVHIEGRVAWRTRLDMMTKKRAAEGTQGRRGRGRQRIGCSGGLVAVAVVACAVCASGTRRDTDTERERACRRRLARPARRRAPPRTWSGQVSERVSELVDAGSMNDGRGVFAGLHCCFLLIALKRERESFLFAASTITSSPSSLTKDTAVSQAVASGTDA